MCSFRRKLRLKLRANSGKPKGKPMVILSYPLYPISVECRDYTPATYVLARSSLLTAEVEDVRAKQISTSNLPEYGKEIVRPC